VCYQTRGLWVSHDSTTITSPDGACIQYLGRSNDARLQSGDGDPIYANAIFFVNRSSMTAPTPQNITISNLTLNVPDGTADPQGVDFGILVAGNNVTVDHVTITGAPLDAIQVTGRANGSNCGCATGVLIKNSTTSAGRRNGMSVVSGINVTLDTNVIQGAGNPTLLGGAAVADTGPWAGIDVEPDLTGYPIQQLTIQHNTIQNNGGAGVLFALDLNGTLPDHADQIVVDSNTITKNGLSSGSFLHGGVCLQGGQAGGQGRLSVTSNQITNNVGFGLCTTDNPLRMQVTLSPANTVSGNTDPNTNSFQVVS
jgi:parallel beta helix pectate lyase-like protein